MQVYNVMLVDDHQVVRTGLKTFLETQSDLKVIAEANNGLEALEILRSIQPDIILMDITMPDMDGIQATREIKREWPATAILALSVHEDKEYFMQMLAAGASGYLTKVAASDELILAIHSVLQGNIYLQPALARWLLEDYQRLSQDRTSVSENGAPLGLDALSSREREVLEMVAQGLTNFEIGEKLELSPKTIARHRERIMKRLNLHSRTELVKFAIKAGLVKLP